MPIFIFGDNEMEAVRKLFLVVVSTTKWIIYAAYWILFFKGFYYFVGRLNGARASANPNESYAVLIYFVAYVVIGMATFWAYRSRKAIWHFFAGLWIGIATRFL